VAKEGSPALTRDEGGHNVVYKPQPLTPDRSVRHLYGSEVRRYRTNANMSLVQLADVLNYSKSHLARIETAEASPTRKVSEALDAAFVTDGYFLRLYRVARHEAHPSQYRHFMELEAQAISHQEYAGHTVPGLLQTEEYARALLRCYPNLTSEQVEERVVARMDRQERRYSENPPHIWAILDEAVLRRPVGGKQCMLRQLGMLLPLMDTPNTKIQVLPFSHGEHALLGSSHTILTFADGSSVAHEEGREASRLYEDKEEVARRQRLYDELRAYALSPRDSAALIRAAMEDCKPCEPAPMPTPQPGERAATATSVEAIASKWPMAAPVLSPSATAKTPKAPTSPSTPPPGRPSSQP
jgi:transcriptional regulator with XRE-family HTH domain